MEHLVIIYHLSLTLNLTLPIASDQITNNCFQIQTLGLSLLLVTGAFVAAAPKLWNNLPLDLRCTSDFEVFKRNLKTHLFKKAFSDIML